MKRNAQDAISSNELDGAEYEPPDVFEEDEPTRASRLSRQEQLEGLADRGCDTLAEYREER